MGRQCERLVSGEHYLGKIPAESAARVHTRKAAVHHANILSMKRIDAALTKQIQARLAMKVSLYGSLYDFNGKWKQQCSQEIATNPTL